MDTALETNGNIIAYSGVYLAVTNILKGRNSRLSLLYHQGTLPPRLRPHLEILSWTRWIRS